MSVLDDERRDTAPDRHQLERLNRLWAILEEQPGEASLRKRLALAARRLIGRVLARQQEFNAALVDHINRNTDAATRASDRMEDVIDLMARQREAMLARERRSEAAVAALAAEHAELRAAVGVLQQATQQLKRELSKPQVAAAPAVTPGIVAATEPVAALAPAPAPFAALDSHKYVGFENEFRGAPAEIAARIESYLPLFAGASNVLDIGCGRGEFLEGLTAHGISCRGIDVNASMVDICVSKGLHVSVADALGYLQAQPDGSLGGLVAAQVVEHLEPGYLVQLLDVAYDKLRPGSVIVLETVNPACWLAFFESYIRDITHVRPVHPDTLKYLLVASGFQGVEVQFRSPYPEAEKLQAVAASALGGDAARTAVETINANVAKLNSLLFTHLDYAAVGRRG